MTGHADLGYHTNSANDTTDMLVSSEANHKWGNSLTLDLIGKLNHQNNKTGSDDSLLTGIQLGYQPKRVYYFTDASYRYDTSSGIENQIDSGIGIGYDFFPDDNLPRLKMQFGAYSRLGDEEKFLGKYKADFSVRIYGPISFREQAGIEVNLDHADYYLIADTSLHIKASERINVGIGLEYGRNSEPIAGYDKDIRKWRSTVGVKF
uniref:Uncharacterized protein n=1 Tax=viral metagenome TaxID=1070528 RepID=A0A6M3L6E2_9ZZZZ